MDVVMIVAIVFFGLIFIGLCTKGRSWASLGWRLPISVVSLPWARWSSLVFSTLRGWS
jgi:hypothetical protein